MLKKHQFARFVHTSAVDSGFAETEVVLTYLLQLLVERGFAERVAFKGGTCIRKMILGSRGRFSTDLDFTARGLVADPDGEILDLAELLRDPFHGIQFHLAIENEKAWRSEDGTSWSIYPTYKHELNSGKLKFEVSMREVPILQPDVRPQLHQSYFDHLEFAPAAIPCLNESEIVAEKLRAAYQRRKARDIYDLAAFAARPKNEELIRGVFLLKLWNVRNSFDPARMEARLRDAKEYDWEDLSRLIPPRDRESAESLLARVRRGFGFLGRMSEVEAQVAADPYQRQRAAMNAVREACSRLVAMPA